MNTGIITTDLQPAIFTDYAWHKLENETRELKTHLIGAPSSEKAEQFVREHQPGMLEGAECFISTDFGLDHLHSMSHATGTPTPSQRVSPSATMNSSAGFGQ